MYWSHFLVLVGIFALHCGAASTGLFPTLSSQSSANSALSTDYCLRRRALQPGVPCEAPQTGTTAMSGGIPTSQGSVPGASSSSGDSSPVLTPTSSSASGPPQSITSSSWNTNIIVPGVTINPLAQSTDSLTSNTVVGVPGITISPPAPSPPPTKTPSQATTTLETTWIPKMTSGSVTVETISFTFDFLIKPPKKEGKDGKSSSEQAHVDFDAFKPKMESAASAFDVLGSAFSAFSSAVSSKGATDSSVAAAGSGLFNLFTGAFSAAADVGSSLESIGLQELDESGKLLEIFEQTEIDIFELGSVIKDIEPLLKSKIDLINGKKILGYSAAITGGIGIGATLRKLVEMVNEPQPAKPTSKPGTTTTGDPSSSSKSSSSSTSSSKSSETAILYCIETVRGTTQREYEDFINSLPDAGKGIRIDYPTIDNQVYGTYLTAEQAKEYEKNPIVGLITPNSVGEDNPDFYNEENSVIPRALHARAGPDPPLNLAQQVASPQHLNLISQGPKNAAARRSTDPPPVIPDYVLSPKAGEGITIFVIDTGLNPNHPEFAKSYNKNDYFVVPNNLMTFPKLIANPNNREEMIPYVPDPDNIMSESMARNHGTCVASLATGVKYGVAKKAHLVPVKYKNSLGQATSLAIESAFRYVIDRVIDTNNGLLGPVPRPGWAVLNLSAGYSSANGLPGYPGGLWASRRDLLKKLLEQCWENDIVTIIAAGNMGQTANFGLHQDIPACLGTFDNALITVGACNADGDRVSLTTRDLGKGGQILTSAQADGQVKCASADGSGTRDGTGTSFAAPQVAGLAAYFLSLERHELPVGAESYYSGGQFIGPDLHIKGQVSLDVRNYIHNKMSYKRFPENPQAVSVAYNGAEHGLCNVVPGTSLKRKRGGIQSREDEYGLSPLVVSGLIDPTATYPLPVCSLSPSSSSSSSSSSSTSSSSASTTSSASVSSVSSTSSISSPPQTPTSATDPAGAGLGTALPATGTFIPTPVPPRGHLPTATPSTSSAKADDQLPCFKCSDGDVIG